MGFRGFLRRGPPLEFRATLNASGFTFQIGQVEAVSTASGRTLGLLAKGNPPSDYILGPD